MRARRSRRLAGLATAGALALGYALVSAPATAAPHAALAADAVTVRVLSVIPNTPVTDPANTVPLIFTLSLTNTTSVPIGDVTITAVRGAPIGDQNTLDASLAQPTPPGANDPGLPVQPSSDPAVTASLPANGSVPVTVPTVSGLLDHAGLCICHNAIYPIWFTATATIDGSATVVGSGETFVPVFKDTPAPVEVSWVWPLLERPHRLTADDQFIDDDLARSVAAGGRLDHLLQVLENVVGRDGVPMTVVLDPELIDELVVMTRGYHVSIDGNSVQGTGGAAATSWLNRLRAVLALPGLELALTPYANPDVQALSDNGLSWSRTTPQAMQAHIASVLGTHPVDDELAWPVGGELGSTAATALARTGVRSVLLNADALHQAAGASSKIPGPATNTATAAPVLVSTPAADLRVFAAPISVAPYLSAALSSGAAGISQLQPLISQLAIAAVTDPATPHPVLMLPQAGLDPDPATATAVILATTVSSWSRPVGVLAALQQTPLSTRASLAETAADGLPAATALAARSVSDSLPALSSMLDPADAIARLSELPNAVQRLESGGWAGSRAVQRSATALVSGQVDSLANGVRLVVPSHGSYTLGSSDSPLPITIDNPLDITVHVRLTVSAVGGVPGFHAEDIGVQTVPPQGKLPVHVPVHVDRAGRIRVQAELSTPAATTSGEPQVLGQPLELSVRSTALGEIGRAITYAAGGLLALALLVRFVRRQRRRSQAARTEAPLPSAAE